MFVMLSQIPQGTASPSTESHGQSRFRGSISFIFDVVGWSFAKFTPYFYLSILFRTVLLYPLSPFFVLFCNIIGELDMDDYNLMRDITQNLSQFAASPYISKLHKLLDALQNLCAPLIEAKQRIGSEVKVANLYPSMAGTQQDYPVAADEHGHLLTDDSCYMDPTVQAYPQQLQTPSDGSYPPDEQLMWQLFNSQLSLDWFESNHFPY